MPLNAKRALPALLACGNAMAHSGPIHWHASDIAGLLLVAALSGVAILVSKGQQ